MGEKIQKQRHLKSSLARNTAKLLVDGLLLSQDRAGDVGATVMGAVVPSHVRDGICVDPPLCRGTSQGMYGSRIKGLVCEG